MILRVDVLTSEDGAGWTPTLPAATPAASSWPTCSDSPRSCQPPHHRHSNPTVPNRPEVEVRCQADRLPLVAGASIVAAVIALGQVLLLGGLAMLDLGRQGHRAATEVATEDNLAGLGRPHGQGGSAPDEIGTYPTNQPTLTSATPPSLDRAPRSLHQPARRKALRHCWPLASRSSHRGSAEHSPSR
jgi:hypothetical protein